jgi:hypothetical protein
MRSTLTFVRRRPSCCSGRRVSASRPRESPARPGRTINRRDPAVGRTRTSHDHVAAVVRGPGRRAADRQRRDCANCRRGTPRRRWKARSTTFRRWPKAAVFRTARTTRSLAAPCAKRSRRGLQADRLDNFHRLVREAAYEARKHDKAAAANVKRRWKVVHKAAVRCTAIVNGLSRMSTRCGCFGGGGVGADADLGVGAAAVPCSAGDDQGHDRHRGASRLGAARRGSVLRARGRAAITTIPVSIEWSKGSGRNSASTATRALPRDGEP